MTLWMVSQPVDPSENLPDCSSEGVVQKTMGSLDLRSKKGQIVDDRSLAAAVELLVVEQEHMADVSR